LIVCRLPTCINVVFPLPAIPMQMMTVGAFSSPPAQEGPASADMFFVFVRDALILRNFKRSK
jgi:hypothetical protein